MQIKGRVQSKFAVVADVLYEDVVFRAPPSLRAVSLRLMILLCIIIVWRVVWWDKRACTIRQRKTSLRHEGIVFCAPPTRALFCRQAGADRTPQKNPRKCFETDRCRGAREQGTSRCTTTPTTTLPWRCGVG
jgi:hypothetical protein